MAYQQNRGGGFQNRTNQAPKQQNKVNWKDYKIGALWLSKKNPDSGILTGKIDVNGQDVFIIAFPFISEEANENSPAYNIFIQPSEETASPKFSRPVAPSRQTQKQAPQNWKRPQQASRRPPVQQQEESYEEPQEENGSF